MTEPLSEIAGQGVTVHGLDRGKLFLGLVVFAPTRGQPEQGPVGGPVTGTGKSFGIDKGLQPEDRMMVDLLPISGNSPGNAAKQMGGEMRDPYPWQDKESGVVGQQVAVALPGFRRPADEGVAAVDGVWCRGKGEAGNQPVAGIDQILEMFADRLRNSPDSGIAGSGH